MAIGLITALSIPWLNANVALFIFSKQSFVFWYSGLLWSIVISPSEPALALNANIKKIGHTRSIKDLVRKQTLLAKSCGCHGIVCAGSDTKFIKKILKKEIIVPGIRLKGDSAGDQQRVSGPKEAFSNGATSIVVGRSITKNNIRKNIKRLIKELKYCVLKFAV